MIEYCLTVVDSACVLGYAVDFSKCSGVFSSTAIKIPFGPRGNPSNRCLMVAIVASIAPESLPGEEQMVEERCAKWKNEN